MTCMHLQARQGVELKGRGQARGRACARARDVLSNRDRAWSVANDLYKACRARRKRKAPQVLVAVGAIATIAETVVAGRGRARRRVARRGKTRGRGHTIVLARPARPPVQGHLCEPRSTGAPARARQRGRKPRRDDSGPEQEKIVLWDAIDGSDVQNSRVARLCELGRVNYHRRRVAARRDGEICEMCADNGKPMTLWQLPSRNESECMREAIEIFR